MNGDHRIVPPRAAALFLATFCLLGLEPAGPRDAVGTRDTAGARGGKVAEDAAGARGGKAAQDPPGSSVYLRMLRNLDDPQPGSPDTDLYSFRAGGLPGKVRITGATVLADRSGITVVPGDSPVDFVLPVSRVASDPCLFRIRIKRKGKIAGELAWLDARGERIGREPAAVIDRVGPRSFTELQARVPGGTNPDVRALRLRLTGIDEPFMVEWIHLFRDVEHRGKPVRLGQKSLLAKGVGSGDAIPWRVRVPARGTLVFSTSFRVKRGTSPVGEVDYIVEAAEPEGRPREIYRFTLSLEGDRRDFLWTDHNVSLADMAGERATLSFRVEASDPKQREQGGDYFWGDPVIFSPRAPEELNVVIIGIDTFRQDEVGAYGNDQGLTPNIDRLATEGVLFTDALSTASWTLPAFASLYTSLYPSTHQAGLKTKIPPRGGSQVPPPTGLSDSALTLAEILRDRGFKTGCFHNNRFLSKEFNMAQGFEVIQRNNRGSGSVDQALAFMRAHLGERLFVFLHFFEPHGPYNPPIKYRNKYLPPKLPDGEEGRRLRRKSLYNGEVAYTDEMVGAFLDGLDLFGLRESTLLILTADHGEEFWEHYEFAKEHYTDKKNKKYGVGHGYSLFREIVNVPLIMRLPGRIEEGDRVGVPASVLDIAPTVLDWLGVEIPQFYAGRSLRAESDRRKARRFNFAESFTRGGLHRQAYYEGPWKIIAEPTTRFIELYNVEKDPWEERNLATIDPARATRMFKKLSAILAKAERMHGELAFGDPPLPTLSAKAKKELKALGYID